VIDECGRAATFALGPISGDNGVRDGLAPRIEGVESPIILPDTMALTTPPTECPTTAARFLPIYIAHCTEDVAGPCATNRTPDRILATTPARAPMSWSSSANRGSTAPAPTRSTAT